MVKFFRSHEAFGLGDAACKLFALLECDVVDDGLQSACSRQNYLHAIFRGQIEVAGANDGHGFVRGGCRLALRLGLLLVGGL